MYRTEDKTNRTKPSQHQHQQGAPSDPKERERRRRSDHCTRCNHRHRQCHQHRGHSHCRSGASCNHDDDCSVDNQAGVCSNRMVQIAVILLVLIMAVWSVSLVAIGLSQCPVQLYTLSVSITDNRRCSSLFPWS